MKKVVYLEVYGDMDSEGYFTYYVRIPTDEEPLLMEFSTMRDAKQYLLNNFILPERLA